MHMLAYAPDEYKNLETLAKTFTIPARQNQFIQENIFNNAPIRLVVIAMNTKSAFTGPFTETHSGIRNLISDKFEYSEGDNQL